MYTTVLTSTAVSGYYTSLVCNVCYHGVITGRCTLYYTRYSDGYNAWIRGVKSHPSRAVGRQMPFLRCKELNPIFCFSDIEVIGTEQHITILEWLQNDIVPYITIITQVRTVINVNIMICLIM